MDNKPKMELYKKIGSKIAELRDQKGVSQTELANALGYSSKAAISLIEKGKRTITAHKLKEISDYFDVSMLDLLGDIDKSYSEEKIKAVLEDLKKLGNVEVDKIIKKL